LTGSNLNIEDTKNWYWTGNTYIFSVGVGYFAFDDWKDIATGGSYFDGARDNSQVYAWTSRPSAALIWATTNYADQDSGGGAELDASQSACSYIYSQFNGVDRYGYCRNAFGNTQPDNVYGNVTYCESNHANTVIFYKGHIYPGAWACGVPNCPFSHSSVYDNEGTVNSYDQIIDYRIHEDDYGQSRLTSKTHDLVFFWACGWGDDSRRGGFYNGHTYGMQVSYMGIDTLTGDGYNNPDGTDRCFIGFNDSSILFTTQTGFSGKTYGDWAEKFFYYALQPDYTIKQALDYATTATHGIGVDFSDCQLYNGYTMIVHGDTRHCCMRIWGDTNLKLVR
jgi:hypothetical protein